MQILFSVTDSLNELCAWICGIIYPLIAKIYNLFMEIAKLDILSSDDVQPIYERFTMMLSIIMVFYITFEMVKYVIQPEQISDKEKGAGKLIQKIMIVIVLIAFVPKIFTLAYSIQNKIIDNGIISKLILGTNTNIEMENLGNVFSANLLRPFYYVAEGQEEEDCGNFECGVIVNANLQTLSEEGELPLITEGLDEKYDTESDYVSGKVEISKIKFYGLIAVAVGIFAAYILILFCVDLGVRWAQMVFLQLIAPVTIIGYLSPKKDGVFEKWCKQCLTTYLDLFIRVVVIYFTLLVCRILTNTGWLEGLENVNKWVYVFLVLGLLMFAQKVPKMLQELFPSMGAASGNFGLKAGERFTPAFNTAKGVARGAGAVTGMALGSAIGAAHGARQGLKGKGAKKAGNAALGLARGAVGGAARGLYNGGKKGNMVKNIGAGVKNQVASNKKFGAKVENDYGIKEQLQDKVGGFFSRSRTEKLDVQKAPRERAKTANEQVVKANDAMREHALKKVYEKDDVKSANLRAMEGRVKSLTEDPATKAKYKVGKYKTDEEAQKAYEEAVKDAKASVNARNYLNQDGTLNQEAYEQEKNRLAAKVKKEDYQKGFATEEEAENAYKVDLGAAQAALKAAKDDAINNYIDTASSDQKLNRLKLERDSQIKDYNDYSSSEFAIDADKIYVYTAPDGKVKISTVENTELGSLRDVKSISNLNAEEFDEYTKQISQSEISKYTMEINSINAKQEAIKRQQDGTGVGENK